MRDAVPKPSPLEGDATGEQAQASLIWNGEREDTPPSMEESEGTDIEGVEKGS